MQPKNALKEFLLWECVSVAPSYLELVCSLRGSSRALCEGGEKNPLALYRHCCQEYLLSVTAVDICASEQMGCEVTFYCVVPGSWPVVFVNIIVRLLEYNSNIDPTHTGCYVIWSQLVITCMYHHIIVLFSWDLLKLCAFVSAAGGAQHFNVSFPK